MTGARVLVLSGVIPTWQTEPHSGRVYAARGAVFIILALVWGRLFDGFEADRWDRPGAAIHLAGVAVISAGPRGR